MGAVRRPATLIKIQVMPLSIVVNFTHTVDKSAVFKEIPPAFQTKPFKKPFLNSGRWAAIAGPVIVPYFYRIVYCHAFFKSGLNDRMVPNAVFLGRCPVP